MNCVFNSNKWVMIQKLGFYFEELGGLIVLGSLQCHSRAGPAVLARGGGWGGGRGAVLLIPYPVYLLLCRSFERWLNMTAILWSQLLNPNITCQCSLSTGYPLSRSKSAQEQCQ